MPLDPERKRALKKQAHHLKPVVIIGQHGLKEGVLAEIDSALDAHELIKIKLAGADKAERETIRQDIVDRIQGIVSIQMIGRTAVFYRANPDKKGKRRRN